MVICSTAFLTLGRAQLKALGSDAPIAVIPHPFGLRTRDEVRAIADQCAGDIVRLATGAATDPTRHAAESADGPVGRAATLELPADIVEFNEECDRRRWTDGLPLIPPTAERVTRMLRGTSRAPTDVVAHVPPAFGIASIERIAVNAVMAGCRPEYLPLLIATIEAATDPRFNLQGIQATTNPVTPWIIVSGPVAKRLGFNAGLNCLGQGTWANATLGRALRLVMQNIGGALPGDMDRATHGQPGKHTFCCAENTAHSPWEALHVERGFSADESVVTVVGAAGTHNLNTHEKDAERLLRALAHCLPFPASNDYHFAGEPWLVLSPEHAAVLDRGGLGKAEVKRRLWEFSKMPASRFAPKDYARAKHTRGSELGDFSPDTAVPITRRAEDIGVIVAGGPGTHSVYIPSFGQTRAVSRRIA